MMENLKIEAEKREKFHNHRAFNVHGVWVWYDSNPDGSRFLLRLEDAERFATVDLVNSVGFCFRLESDDQAPYSRHFVHLEFKN